jgi:hypothetical protein
MDNIQKSIFECVIPANGSSAEYMRCIADSVDMPEVEIASCMEDGDALHSVFAESSMSSQESDLSAEIFKILGTPEYDDLANQVANIYAFPQERSAESSMSFQGSNPFAEQVTNILVFPQKRSAIAGTSSQGSDPPVQKKIKRTNAESSPAVVCTSSQGSDPLVRKKIKRNDDDSSEAQQAQSKNADRACSKRACMRLDGRKLEINGRIIRLGSKESVFVKLLFEKILGYS